MRGFIAMTFVVLVAACDQFEERRCLDACLAGEGVCASDTDAPDETTCKSCCELDLGPE